MWRLLIVLAQLALFEKCSGGFVYTTCKKGFEKLLKCEIQNSNPSLKFAFSRPGLITWKQSDDSGKFDSARSIFMRSFGQSVSAQATTAADIIAAASDIVTQQPGTKRLRLHVWGREEEQGLRIEHPQVTTDRAQRVEKLKGELYGLKTPFLVAGDETPAENGEVILDVVVGENESEKIFVGTHIHTHLELRCRTGYANNLLPCLILPPESPSRAYLKIEEAIVYLGITMQAGETVVEIGSAPGGAAYSLLQRGLKVWGIDPCPPGRSHDPTVLKSRNFTEVRGKLGQIKASQMPSDVQWLLCDANVGAYEAVAELKEMCKKYSSNGKGGGFRGLVYTLKIGDEVFDLAAKSPQKVLDYIESVRRDILSTGLFDEQRTVAASLPSHRQEVVIFAPVK